MPSSDIEFKLKDYALKIAEAIFNNQSAVELEGNSYPIQKFKSNRLRYIDVFGYRFIEQNPNKMSHWAKLAQAGKKILWIFRDQTYYARVIDGQFTLLEKDPIYADRFLKYKHLCLTSIGKIN